MSKNRGLPTNFRLIGGRFGLVEGKEKVDDNMRMLICFVGWFRYFRSDFVLDFYRFYQSTGAMMDRYRGIFRLRMMEVVRKYVPFAELRALDFRLEGGDRRRLAVVMEYEYRLGVEESGEVQVLQISTDIL